MDHVQDAHSSGRRHEDAVFVNKGRRRRKNGAGGIILSQKMRERALVGGRVTIEHIDCVMVDHGQCTGRQMSMVGTVDNTTKGQWVDWN